MPYLPLARKYRPQTFDEIVGQDHVATTLKNAINLDKTAHAYLFTGPRGVGKTSTARIFAKSLNCEKGPSPTPCNKCTACNEISQGISMDVIEIDGASNRGIDEIRNLKENIKFASVHGKFRIYIIDEVHMLTQEAFNALLKTLEEPPAHVKFIFATTRPYKVIPTIVSRCQRFDFKKIAIQDIIDKLKEIKQKEKLDLEDEALFLISKASDGSLRDGEVILDQLLSFTKGKVKSGNVREVLGLLEQDILFDLASSLINNNKEKALEVLNELINNGKDPTFIASSVIEYFRNLMVAKVTKDKKKLERFFSEEDFYRLEDQASKLSLDEILYIIYSLSTSIDLIKKTALGRIPLEITLIKLTERKGLTSVRELTDRLSALEERLKGGSFGYEKLPDIKESPPAQKEQKEIVKPPIVAEEEVAAEKDILLLQKIKNSWSKVLNFIKMRKMSLATFLSEGELLKVRDNILFVGFDKNNTLHKEAIEADSNKSFVEKAIHNIVGENVKLNVETVETEYAKEPEMPLEENVLEEELESSPKRIDPIVESAIDIFDGRIVDIREKRNKE